MSSQDWFADKTAPMLAVEMQYYRVPRDRWELMLFRLRQMGANTVSTYVMWGWHEPAEGQFDFTGQSQPERDLITFLRLAQEMGLLVILKPGPFIDAEVLGGGIPSWLLVQHPECHALRHNSDPWRHSDSNQSRVTYLHPTYLEYTARWFTAFSQAAASFQWPQGPVIALQVDNETPGDGMIAGDVEDQRFDFHFRGDYNLYCTQTLWQRWLSERYGGLEALNRAYDSQFSLVDEVPFPTAWTPPQTAGDLRYWSDVACFTDWTFSEGLRVYSTMLRERGWHVPLFQDLLCMPWEASGLLVDMAGFAGACGWLGHNVYPEAVRNPIVRFGWYQMGFEEYVQYAFWRTRLVKGYSPQFPSFVPEISATGDFFFQSLFAGGVEAVSVYVGMQSPVEPPQVGAFPRWAEEASIRIDGSVRRRWWNAKTLFDYLGADGQAFARSRVPAEIILGYTHVPELAGQWYFWPEYVEGPGGRAREAASLEGELALILQGSDSGAASQRLAQQMVHLEMDFDVLDIDAATVAQLSQARMLVLPAARVMARRTQQRLARYLRRGGQIFWVGGELPEMDESLVPCDELRKSARSTGRIQQLPSIPDDWPSRLNQAGLRPSFAWTGDGEVDATVRHGPGKTTFLSVVNRSGRTFDGAVHYLDEDGRECSLRLRGSGPHVQFVALRAGVLKHAVLYGDEGAYAEAGGTRYSIDRGQAVLAHRGSSMLISAPESVIVQITRPGGWGGAAAWRLLLDGQVIPSAMRVEDDELHIHYHSEEGARENLALLVHLAGAELDPGLLSLLMAGLSFRRLLLERVAEACLTLREKLASLGENLTYLSLLEAAAGLQKAAEELRRFTQEAFSLEGYPARLQAFQREVEGPAFSLVDGLRRLRAELTSGERPSEQVWAERELARLLNLLAMVG